MCFLSPALGIGNSSLMLSWKLCLAYSAIGNADKLLIRVLHLDFADVNKFPITSLEPAKQSSEDGGNNLDTPCICVVDQTLCFGGDKRVFLHNSELSAPHWTRRYTSRKNNPVVLASTSHGV